MRARSSPRSRTAARTGAFPARSSRRTASGSLFAMPAEPGPEDWPVDPAKTLLVLDEARRQRPPHPPPVRGGQRGGALTGRPSRGLHGATPRLADRAPRAWRGSGRGRPAEGGAPGAPTLRRRRRVVGWARRRRDRDVRPGPELPPRARHRCAGPGGRGEPARRSGREGAGRGARPTAGRDHRGPARGRAGSSARNRRLHGRAHRHDEGGRGPGGRRPRGGGQPHRGRGRAGCGGAADGPRTRGRPRGQDGDPRALRRARAPALRRPGRGPAPAVEVLGQPGLRRHLHPRGLGEHARVVRAGRARRGRRHPGAAGLLDRLRPLRGQGSGGSADPPLRGCAAARTDA